MLSGTLPLLATAEVWHLPVATTAPASVGGESADAHLARGLELHKEGNIEAAIAEYRRAATLNPQSALAYYHLGVAHYQQKRVDEAIASCRQALVLERSARASGAADASQFSAGVVRFSTRAPILQDESCGLDMETFRATEAENVTAEQVEYAGAERQADADLARPSCRKSDT